MSGFTVSIDYLRFTIPSISAESVVQLFKGTFRQSSTGKYGYTRSWFLENADRGQLAIYTGKPQAPREVHVDITGGITGGWSYEFIQSVFRFVRDHKGKVGRLDIAFDDTESAVSVAMVEEAVRRGQAVKRSKQWQKIEKGDDSNESIGHTLYLGSRQSDTFLRVYDKAKQLRAQRRECLGSWVRWELEIKHHRAEVCGTVLAAIDEAQFREWAVGLLRSAVDFRDTTYEHEAWERYRAPLLPWWEALTAGFAKARLAMARVQKKIEDVKQWAAQSLAPMLAVLVASREAGQAWLEQMIVEAGPSRWKQKHYDLLAQLPKHTYILKGGLCERVAGA